MTTPNRNYTEFPTNVTPDVPYWGNKALREIDVDVKSVSDRTTTAQAKADQAFTNAGAAQTTATTGVTKADTAQAKADQAFTNAGAAQTTANTANAKADANATAIADPKIKRGTRELNATLAAPVDMNNLKTVEWNGGWTFRSPTVTQYVSNLPAALATGTAVDIDINVRSNGVVDQWARGYGTTLLSYWRTAANTTASAWTAWQEQDFNQKARVDSLSAAVTANSTALAGLSAGPALARGLALQQRFIKARGGATAAAGKAIFAFRYDHDTNAFGDKVLPLHRERALVSSLAIMSGLFTDANGQDRNNLRSWPVIQDWNLMDAVELQAHGATHRDAQTEAELDAEFVAPLAFYKTNLPKCRIDIIGIPGVTVKTGYTVAFGGFANGPTVEAYVDTSAGRRMLANYPVAMGYTPGVYRALDGTIAQGLPHYSMDTKTAADIIPMMDEAVKRGMGLCLMAHPSLLDDLTGENKFTTADLAVILDYAKQLQDEGKADVMTVAGLTLADSNKSEQLSLITNGNFTDGFTGWAGAAGYSTMAGGASGTTSAGMLTQNLSLSRFGWALGVTWELAADITAGDSDLVAQAVVEDKDDVTRLTSKAPARTIPAGQTRTVRAPVSIPVVDTANLRFKVGRVSGGPVAKITNVRFVAK